MPQIPAARVDKADALRSRIGWICQSVRWAALAYLGWVLWMIIRFWADADVVRRAFSYRAGIALTEPMVWQRLAGFSINLIAWALMAMAVYAVWKMMAEHLAGRTFGTKAADWLRRVGLLGLMALIFDIVARPIVLWLVSMPKAVGSNATWLFLQPSDLLNGMFLLAFVALAHIFKSAAELADENAQFV